MDKMLPSGKPYLTIQTVRAALRLYDISAQSCIHPGVYDVLAGDAWIRLEAAEPRISTSSCPVRAIDFYGAETEPLLSLEEYLLTNGTSLQMKAENGEIFTVEFPKSGVRSSFYVSGVFLTAREEAEFPFPCRIALPEGKEFLGMAYGAASHKGERQMAIGDLPLAARLDIYRAVAAGADVLVENIP